MVERKEEEIHEEIRKLENMNEKEEKKECEIEET